MMIEIITKGTDHPLDALLTLTNMKHVIGKILIMIHYELVTGCSLFVIMQTTVWKFHDFAITQILREINFGDSRSAKYVIFTHLEALNLHVL